MTSSASFVIGTRNRPDELVRCLKSIAAQTVRPDEVVIVDASDSPDETAVRSVLEPAGIRLVLRRVEPGRTTQLRAGFETATGDPVFVVDDDVELEPTFVESMLKAFEDPDVGGAQGSIVDDMLRPWPIRAFKRLFLLSRHTRNAPARVLASGYYTSPARPDRVVEADALRLCGLAFRRSVLSEFQFDDALMSDQGYALKEDVDFSYRVSRKHKLVIVPDARFRHLRTPQSRISVRERSRQHVVNNYRVFRKNLAGTTRQRLAFGWALFGRFLYETARSIVKLNPAFVGGYLIGLREVIREGRTT